MTPDQRQRYARQIVLPCFGETGQSTLLDSRVLMIGAGGLGSPVALYLAAAGVGQLVISDFDRVDDSNLQRQIIHTTRYLGELKAESAAARILELNAGCEVTCLPFELDGDELLLEVEKADVVVDCSDNFPTRYAVNRACLATKTPWVMGAAIRCEGQLGAFDPRLVTSPCYECLYPDTGIEGASCAREGIMAPVVGIVGSMQAQEVLNLLLGQAALVGRLLLLDAALMDWRNMKLDRNPACAACGVA